MFWGTKQTMILNRNCFIIIIKRQKSANFTALFLYAIKEKNVAGEYIKRNYKTKCFWT